MNIKFKKSVRLLFLACLFFWGCEKNYVPRDLDAFQLASTYTQTIFNPTLGRDMLYNNLFLDNNGSSRPITFKLLNVRTYDGLPAPEMSAKFPVYVWKESYTGNETSLAEIEAKRSLEDHSFLELRDHSGDVVFWGSNDLLARSIRPLPDSGYKFDVEVGNSGGSKVIKDLKIQPYAIREYEPNNADLYTGLSSNDRLNPTAVSNIIGDSTQTLLFTNDVFIYLHKVTSTGSSLKIFFIDKDNNFIDPGKFNLTDWPNLIHGFNMQKTATYVKYDVAYPIPLVERPTKYTTLDGKNAHLTFAYDRIAAGGYRVVSNLLFDFAIYTKGDWELIVSFPRESPKFDND